MGKNRTVEKFREKCAAKDVKKYYAKFDVAVSVELGLKTTRINHVAHDDEECCAPVELDQIQDRLFS
jgi:hypothetical protein